MSRPFSYNDKNFTVIGNVLFCHIIVKKPLDTERYIVEIPPEIYKRLLHKSSIFMCVGVSDEVIESSFINVGTSKKY